MKSIRFIYAASLTAALVLLTATSACNSTGCLENQSSIPLAGFYSSGTEERVVIDSIKVYGLGAPGDSSLTASIRASQVYLPLRSSAEATSFCFRYLQKDLDCPELIDTLTLEYDSEPRFVSEECGAMYFYHVRRMSYTRHLIDSVAMPDSLINNVDIERLKIYFLTQEVDDTPGADPDQTEQEP